MLQWPMRESARKSTFCAEFSEDVSQDGQQLSCGTVSSHHYSQIIPHQFRVQTQHGLQTHHTPTRLFQFLRIKYSIHTYPLLLSDLICLQIIPFIYVSDWPVVGGAGSRPCGIEVSPEALSRLHWPLVMRDWTHLHSGLLPVTCPSVPVLRAPLPPRSRSLEKHI